MPKCIVNSVGSLARALGKLQADLSKHKYLRLSWSFGRDRSLEQNALWAGMYKRLYQFGVFASEADAKSYCKLHIGIPIMRRVSEDFRSQYDEFVRPLPYEKKLELMGNCPLLGPDGFPVTRLFGRTDGVEYTSSIADHPRFVDAGVNFEDLLNG